MKLNSICLLVLSSLYVVPAVASTQESQRCSPHSFSPKELKDALEQIQKVAKDKEYDLRENSGKLVVRVGKDYYSLKAGAGLEKIADKGDKKDAEALFAAEEKARSSSRDKVSHSTSSKGSIGEMNIDD